MAFKVIWSLLLLAALTSAKSHHHKHHHKNSTDHGDAKSGIARRPNFLLSGTKKQSLGMPFNNLDQQGLGGEPVGHIHDATEAEGVGGLGGDADGMPIGMGAGAEPLGMAKGKAGPMDGHGGSIQGLSEDVEGIHNNEDVNRPFSEAEAGGEMESAHGGAMMEGGKSNGGFMSQGMMSNGGGSNGMGSFTGGSNEMMTGGGGGGGGGGAGGAFMEQPEEGGEFRGPKKDPLGGEIRPFNDEYKNDDGKHLLGRHGNNGMSGHGTGMPYDGMSKFGSMSEEGGQGAGGGGEIGEGSEQMELRHGKATNAVEEMGKWGTRFISPESKEAEAAGAPLSNFIEEQRGSKVHEIDATGRMDLQSQKTEAMIGGGDVEKEISAMQQEERNTENRDFPAAPSTSLNPSTAEISKALNGNPSELSSVNIQGDNEVAEMVRKVAFQKELFAGNEPRMQNAGRGYPSKQVVGRGRVRGAMMSQRPLTHQLVQRRGAMMSQRPLTHQLVQRMGAMMSQRPLTHQLAQRRSNKGHKLAHTKTHVAHHKHPRAKSQR